MVHPYGAAGLGAGPPVRTGDAPSPTTIKSNVGRSPSKLDLRDRVQAVVLVYETGLIAPGGGRPEPGRVITHGARWPGLRP